MSTDSGIRDGDARSKLLEVIGMITLARELLARAMSEAVEAAARMYMPAAPEGMQAPIEQEVGEPRAESVDQFEEVRPPATPAAMPEGGAADAGQSRVDPEAPEPQIPVEMENGRRLAPREIQLLQLLGSGYSLDKAAEAMGVSPSYLGQVTHRLRGKFGVRSTVEVIDEARRQGLIGGESGPSEADRLPAGTDGVQAAASRMEDLQYTSEWPDPVFALCRVGANGFLCIPACAEYPDMMGLVCFSTREMATDYMKAAGRADGYTAMALSLEDARQVALAGADPGIRALLLLDNQSRPAIRMIR